MDLLPMKNLPGWRCFRLITLGIALLAGGRSQAATVSTWNAASGQWSSAANWSHVPGTIQFPNNGNGGLNYQATLSNSGVITLDQDITLDGYTQSNGTLTSAFTLSVNETMNWTGGILGGSGTTVIASGATLNMSGSSKILGDTTSAGHVLINNGTANLIGTGFVLSIRDSIAPDPASKFINNGTFDVSGAASIGRQFFAGANAVGSFVNAAGATFHKTGTGTTTSFNTNFANTGTINVAAGTLDFQSSFTQSAGQTILAGGNLTKTNGGALIFNGGSLGGSGIVSGAVTMNSGSTLEPGLGASTGQALTAQNNLTFNPGSMFQVDFFNGLSADQLNIGGNATFNGALALQLVNAVLPAYNQTFSIANITGTRTGTFGLTEGQAVGYGLHISFLGGDGNDVRLSSGLAPGAAPIETATPSQPAYVSGSYSSANTGFTYTFQSLTVEPGTTAVLGPNDTLTLTSGPLVIAPGAIFSGNGLINGHVINHGLLRIPIVRLDAVSNIQGGYTEITVPVPGPAPVITTPAPVVVNAGTMLGIGGGSTGGGVEAANPVTISAPNVSNQGSIRLAPPVGAVGYDASLAITGSYTQTETGQLRLFIGGDEKGVTYSHLGVVEMVTLSGEIQLVLTPDLFGFLPMFGETFDLIESPAGISIPDGLLLTSFVTALGASYVPEWSLTPYVSGIENDPDDLKQIGEPIFTYQLVEEGTVLRATYVGTVPEPSIGILFAAGAAALIGRRRRR